MDYFEYVDDLIFLGSDTTDDDLIFRIVECVNTNTTYSDTMFGDSHQSSSSVLPTPVSVYSAEHPETDTRELFSWASGIPNSSSPEPDRVPITRHDRVPLVLRPGFVLHTGEEPPMTDDDGYESDVFSDYAFYIDRTEWETPSPPVSDDGDELRRDLAEFALARHILETTTAPPMYSPPRPRSKTQ